MARTGQSSMHSQTSTDSTTVSIGPSKEEANEMVKTESTPWLWNTLTLYVLVAGCGLLCLLGKRRSASAAASPPAH